MKIRDYLTGAILICGMLISVFGQENIRHTGISNLILAQADTTESQTVIETQGSTPRIKSKKRAEYSEGKSPLIAAGLSLLVPGAGEFYGRDYLRSGIFFGIDVLTLSMWAYYDGEGDDKTDEFQDYADKGFSDSLYYGGLLAMTENSLHWLAYWDNEKVWNYDYFMNRDNWTQENESADGYRDTLTVTRLLEYSFKDNVFNGHIVNLAGGYAQFTHNLPETKTQQYYEMVGKYHQFACGWDDFTGYADANEDGVPDTKAVVVNDSTIVYVPVLKTDTSNIFDYSESGYNSTGIDFYEDLRDEANKAYEMGQNFLMVTLLNHVASAFDASYVIKSRYQIGTQLRIENTDKAEKIGIDNYKLTYSVRW